MSDDAPADHPGEPAGGSGAPRRVPRLRLLSFQPQPPRQGADADTVHLLREYKGPTVTSLVRASPAVVTRLPGRVRTVLEAIERDDLAVANRCFDDAVNILPGPGSRPALPALWPWFAALWLVAVVASVIALCWP